MEFLNIFIVIYKRVSNAVCKFKNIELIKITQEVLRSFVFILVSEALMTHFVEYYSVRLCCQLKDEGTDGY